MGQTRGGGGRQKVGEQVTIVRIAIEEILEEAILVFDHRVRAYVCVRTRAYKYTRVYKSRMRANTQVQGALVRPPPWRIAAGRDYTVFETTLRIDIRYQ